MREAAKIATYVAGVVLGAALLAPPLYWLGQWAIRKDVLPALRPFAFDKYFNRATLLTALVLLVPWLRWLGLRPRDLPLARPARPVWQLVLGMAAGLTSLLAVAAALIAQGDLIWRGVPRASDICAAVVSGGVVAVLEEGLFRGVLFGVLRRSLSWRPALMVLTLLFASLHFVRQNPALPPARHVTWTSGITLLPHLLWQFTEPTLLASCFTTLVLMGWALGVTVVRTRALHVAVGLHAGWVCGLKWVNASTWHDAPTLWIGHDLRSGLAPMLLMALVNVVVAWLPPGDDGRAQPRLSRDAAARKVVPSTPTGQPESAAAPSR